MKVLFIGGTGVISSACSRLAIEKGIDLYLLNRGQSFRSVPEKAHLIKGDVRDKESVSRLISEFNFDVVVNWIVFTRHQIESDLEIFRDKTNQYIFISSASAYQTPPASLPVTEKTPLSNPFWQYSRDKIACEERLMQAWREEDFPVTIVRPSHTYDQTMLPILGKYTTVDRMRRGKRIIVHGDGTSIWVLTHHMDFARGFIGLLGNTAVIGEAVHITSDEWLTWNQIYEIIAQAAGATADIVHIPSEVINMFDPQWGEGLLGDKAHSMIFDNSKIKRLVPRFNAEIPFTTGAGEIINWFDHHPDQQIVDPVVNNMMDRILDSFQKIRA